MTERELRRIIYDVVKADVETEADAENAFQEGYSVGFNDCRARVLSALLAVGETARVGEHLADYSPLTAEEIAAPSGAEELLKNSVERK